MQIGDATETKEKKLKDELTQKELFFLHLDREQGTRNMAKYVPWHTKLSLPRDAVDIGLSDPA